MKPKILIAIGIVLSLIILAWIFLFFAGEETRQDIFSALNIGDTTGEDVGVGDFFGEEESSPVENKLRQLSLRRVIGFLAHAETSAQFIEAGTGHIYAVDVTNGEESRISNITIPTARTAAISPDLRFAAIAPADQDSLTVVILPTASTSLDSFVINTNVFTFAFTETGDLLFAEQQGSAVTAYLYDIESRTQTQLFTVPFADAAIVWGDSVDSTHLIYPRTSSRLEGYLYQVKAGKWSRLPASGYGLSATGNADAALVSVRSTDDYETSLIDLNTTSLRKLDFSVFPEKCFLQEGGALCGVHNAKYDQTMPDSWYSGETTFSDELWYIDFSSNNLAFIVNLEVESGRALDVIGLAIENTSGAAYFINKTDQSLWIYDEDFIPNVGDN